MRFCSVSTKDQTKRVPLSRDTLLESILAEEIELSHSCGGNGTCGTCQVKVLNWGSGGSPARNEIESELSLDRGLRENERLACQLLAEDAEGGTFELPE